MTLPSICFVAPRVYLIASGDSRQGFAGGAEVQQTHLARGLARAGHQVTVLAGDYGQPDEAMVDGIRFIKLHERGAQIPLLRYFHPRLTCLWQGMKKADADIYYQRGAGAATFVAGLFAKLNKRNFVFAAAHDLDLIKPRTQEMLPGRGGWRDLQLYFQGIRWASAIVAQHESQREQCLKWFGSDATWIPSCSTGSENHTGSPEGVVLWVSMIRAWKHPERFVDLAESLPETRFKMIGGKSTRANDHASFALYDELWERVGKLGNIDYLGFLPYHEAEGHFDGASVFVNTSDHEGFPNTFLQAWSRGIPTVSFFDCGARDENGPIGFVVRNQEEMAKTIERLIRDQDLWRRESQRCRRHFLARHSVPAVVARYQELFGRLHGKARGHGA